MRIVQFVKGYFYHIFNRGVDKRNIFESDSDMWRFLQALFLFNDEKSSLNLLYRLERDKGAMNFNVLKKFFQEQGRNMDPLVRICADCLMPNHFHLLLEEIKENGISRFMHKVGTGYANFFNKKYDRVGSLFQGPYKAVMVEKDDYLQYLLAYINIINPAQLIEPEIKEKGVVDIDKVLNFAETYQWSTHKYYLGKMESIIINKGIFQNFFPTSEEYRDFSKKILLGKQYKSAGALFLE
ncbi:MAG: hypothetical protein A2626_02535 [Candidatus Nealsonbacteria bacterium RIFCSPHIGHO2_01_FULL_38_55]|uniref:Transposase IS200-like domain-containing protein n=1 Tax=Candidatus Nealsonbacteria bacterium RIFCSPHIGHO2_01_FULL_38_55 TaxID=1801664 RepID=A0A1G2E371_9BACT|nr:MAG: hypothetical protein A2626_02535 [Candidatus Nealsonbacteria bacterium RIFCSPHIGHO2_01_FULL_38_55]